MGWTYSTSGRKKKYKINFVGKSTGNRLFRILVSSCSGHEDVRTSDLFLPLTLRLSAVLFNGRPYLGLGQVGGSQEVVGVPDVSHPSDTI
jgi:hypothetical protein